MDKKFHINPTNGKVSLCRAANAGCPFGGQSGEENHFASIADARLGYEKMMAGESVPAANVKTRSPSELNAEVKSTTKHGVFMEAIENGSERTLSNIALNPNASPRVLEAALQKSKDEKTRGRLLFHKNFPVENLQPDGFAELLTLDKEPWSKRKERAWKSNNLTDAHVEAIGKIDASALLNEENKLTHNAIAKFSEGGSLTLGIALRSPRYSLKDRAEKIDMDSLRNVNAQLALAERNDPIGMEKLARRATREKNAWVMAQIARNKNLNTNTLSLMVKSFSKEDTNRSEVVSSLISAYKNPKSDQATRDLAMELSPTVKAYDNIVKLEAKHDGKLSAVIKYSGEIRSNNSQERIINFDSKKVKELGMNASDIDVFVRHYKGSHLWSTSYEESSGTYRGYID